MAKTVTTAEFENEVIKSTLPVLVDFYADWCGPCKMIAPIVDQLSLELADKAKIVKVNVDEQQDIAAQYQVMSIPTLIVFQNGEKVNQSVGVGPNPKEFITALLQPYMAKE